MALKLNIMVDTEYGVQLELKDVIANVIGVVGDKNNMIVRVGFTKDGKELPHKAYSFITSLVEINFIKQAYQYLKTLEEFKDAEDC